MIKIYDRSKNTILLESTRNRAEHKVFVEGKMDSIVVKILFKNSYKKTNKVINVEVGGGSKLLARNAKRSHENGQKHYYIIDRDHHSDEFVECKWNNFLNQDTPNLLVWRLREIENYLIAPEFLLKSKRLTIDEKTLKIHLETLINNCYLTDIANHSILSIIAIERPDFSRIKLSYPSSSKSIQDIRNSLENNSKLLKHLKDVEQVSMDNIIDEFSSLSEKVEEIKNNKGIYSNEFMKYCKGKSILEKMNFESLFNFDDCTNKEALKKEDFVELIVQEILEQEQNYPDDFKDFVSQIEQRMDLYEN